MGQTAGEKAWIKEGLAAYVGISAPETPKYLLANNFLLEYFEVPAEVNREYNYKTFDQEETLYTEDTVDTDRLQQSFNKFLNRYLGEDIIREENRRLNENKHYYFPITQSMLVGSPPTLRHLLFSLQNIGKNFNFEEMQSLLEHYIFHDNTGISHIMKILLQNQDSKIRLKSLENKKSAENFWDMLSGTERKRMEQLAFRLNEDLRTLLIHPYFCKLDFYRRYNYLAVLLTSYVIQYIVCRRGGNTYMLCQGAPRDSRLSGAFHRASCSNYAEIRTLFPSLLTRFYTELIQQIVEKDEMLHILADGEQIWINDITFNDFIDRMLNDRKKRTGHPYEVVVKAFGLTEGEKKEISAENFVVRYISLTGTKSGSMLTKISSTLPTSGRQIDMVFPKNRAKQKYFAMSETLSEFYVRLHLARKGQQYDYLDHFIEELQNRYRMILVKTPEGEKALKAMHITLSAQEYAKNKQVFIELLSSINCLIKLSDSGYVVTLPEEKGDFKLL